MRGTTAAVVAAAASCLPSEDLTEDSEVLL